MKKYTRIITFAILLLTLIAACKKSNSDAPKDYTASIKDKTWWGEFYYTGKSAEYYSIHFNSDGTLTWSEYSGDYAGTWQINSSLLTIVFDASGNQFQAKISDYNNMEQIVNPTGNGYTIIKGQMVTGGAKLLENTTWKGSAGSGVTTIDMQMTFMANVKVELTFGSILPKKYSYDFAADRGVIRINKGFFGIITSSTEMKGSVDNVANLWEVVKQ